MKLSFFVIYLKPGRLTGLVRNVAYDKENGWHHFLTLSKEHPCIFFLNFVIQTKWTPFAKSFVCFFFFLTFWCSSCFIFSLFLWSMISVEEKLYGTRRKDKKTNSVAGIDGWTLGSWIKLVIQYGGVKLYFKSNKWRGRLYNLRRREC